MSTNEHDLKMPSFGSDMHNGCLTEWLVKEGDHIKRGDVVAVIETSKGAIELDIFEDAQVLQLLVKEGDNVAVGEPIARLSAAKTSSKPATTNQENTLATPAKALNLTTIETSTSQPAANNHLATHKNFVLATPAARQLAQQQQLSLAAICVNNNNRVVTLAMVEQASQDQDPNSHQHKHTQVKTGFDKDAMRQAISDTVTRS
ncbi:biotin/lipoyl-containing protein, partial [Neptunomonas sp.]|uniref:biotin/lipoyl-containing protein n=1 Tax=Neptunomonas sp. TaxID=1971898 RepID=UPI00356A0A6F